MVPGKTSTWPKCRTNLVWNPDLLLTSPVTLGKSLPFLIWKSGTLISTWHGYWDYKGTCEHHAHSMGSMKTGLFLLPQPSALLGLFAHLVLGASNFQVLKSAQFKIVKTNPPLYLD